MTLITVWNATIVAQTERFAEMDNAPSAWAEPIATAMSSICAKILRIAGNAMINALRTRHAKTESVMKALFPIPTTIETEKVLTPTETLLTVGNAVKSAVSARFAFWENANRA